MNTLENRFKAVGAKQAILEAMKFYGETLETVRKHYATGEKRDCIEYVASLTAPTLEFTAYNIEMAKAMLGLLVAGAN